MEAVGQTNLQCGPDGPASRNAVVADERRDIRVQVAYLRMPGCRGEQDRDHDRGARHEPEDRPNPGTRDSSTNS